MKKKNRKLLSIPLGLILVYFLWSFDFKAKKVQNYASEFEVVNQFIIQNKLTNGNILNRILNQKNDTFSILNKAISNSKLCEIQKLGEDAIVYKFQCESNSRDNFIDTDNKYYLLKIFNNKKKILKLEQYVDFASEPIKLENDWFFIKQQIAYD